MGDRLRKQVEIGLGSGMLFTHISVQFERKISIDTTPRNDSIFINRRNRASFRDNEFPTSNSSKHASNL